MALFSITEALGLDKVGEWCVDIINAGYALFNKLVYSGLSILSKPIDDPAFQDFWNVILPLHKVMCTIASTLMMLLFVYNFATDAWTVRHDVDAFDVVKSVLKLSFAVLLVNNSLLIIKSIFSMGAALAGGFMDTNYIEGAALSDGDSGFIKTGVSGFSGLLIFLVFLIATITLIVMAVGITLEMYERVFKVYILIPFSAISFSTFVLGDGNRGNEVFYGYLRSVITTALEAVIIVLCISFTSSLVAGGNTLEQLFPALSSATTEDVTLYTKDDLTVLFDYVYDNNIPDFDSLDKLKAGGSLSQGVYDIVTSGRTYANVLLGADGGLGRSNNELLVGMKMSVAGSATVSLCNKFGWLNAFAVIVKVLFPCMLCTTAVKKVNIFAGMILGRA